MNKEIHIQLLAQRYLVSLILILSATLNGQNMVTFVITDIPPYTPTNDSLYLSSSLDNWEDTNASKRFKLFPDGFYRLTVDVGANDPIEYKINRGNWDKVEGNSWGDYMANRKLNYNDSIYEILLKVAGWQDLHYEVYPPIQILVNAVPKNTPHDASIYITGSFNNWIDNDINYKLERKDDGTYFGTIPHGYDTICYKFTRGPWESIESRWDGGMLSNRNYISSQDNNHTIIAEIEGWQDLSTKSDWLKALFLAFLFQALIIANTQRRGNKNQIAVILSLIIGISFFFKYFYLNHNMLNAYPKAYLLPAILYTCGSTLAFMLLKSSISQKKIQYSMLCIFPILFAIWYASYLFIPSNTFFLNIITDKYATLFFCTYGFNLITQQVFLFQIKTAITQQGNQVSDMSKKLYLGYRYLVGIGILIAGITLLLYLQGVDIKFVSDLCENLIWISIGISLIYYQSLLMLFNTSSGEKAINSINKEALNDEHWFKLKDKLSYLMEDKHVYLNPELTLSDLASDLLTNNQYVSRLINEGFKKSYTDYINDYRIDAFIKMVKDDSANETFLYYAYKVGFNSKSAFNRAFKKMNNTTPSEYFSTLEVDASIKAK